MKPIKEPHIILSSTWRVGYTSTGAIQSPIYVIVCGDLGLCWAKDKTFDYNCKNFKQKSYTTLWVQGNHENFDMIAEFPMAVRFVILLGIKLFFSSVDKSLI